MSCSRPSLLGALISVRRMPRRERPVAGAALELRLVEEGGRQGAFVSERDSPVERHAHSGPRLVEPPGEHQPHGEREARTAGVGHLGLRAASSRKTARSSNPGWARPPRASRTRRPSRAQSRESARRPLSPQPPTPPGRARAPAPGRRPERRGSHRCSTRSSRRGRRLREPRRERASRARGTSRSCAARSRGAATRPLARHREATPRQDARGSLHSCRALRH